MYVQKTARGMLARRAIGIALIAGGGCGTVIGPAGSDTLSSTLNLTALGLDSIPTHFESDLNNLFDTAEPVALASVPLLIRGRVDGANDVDVYNIGPVEVGDRIIVEMSTAGTVDGAIALFDESGASFLVNDHRNVYLGRATPFINVVADRAAGACYVAATATPGYDHDGDYALLTSVEPGAIIPEPRSDVVLLDFAGENGARIGSRSAIDVPAFDAAAIDAVYDGWSEVIMADVVAIVREDFAGFNVTVLSTSEGSVYDGSMTRIFFGTYDAALLGVAEGVDEFNSDTRQEAIVFTDTFAAFMRINPSTLEMAQAIANVASHEIGHLLGLVHTSDPGGIMDVTASLQELLRDQSFTRSPIYTAVFPVGDQDALKSLMRSVGGDEETVIARRLVSQSRSFIRQDDGDRTPARLFFALSACGFCGQ